MWEAGLKPTTLTHFQEPEQQTSKPGFSQPCKLSSGLQVSFVISIESQKCLDHGKPEVIKIKPLGFTEEVEVVLNFICDCQCAVDGEGNSKKCSEGHGTFECGACK